MYLSFPPPEISPSAARLGNFFGFGETRTRRTRIGHIHPDKSILLFAGIAAGVDTVHLQILVSREGGDELALAVVGVEGPAMVGALDVFSIEVAAVERHAAVRAGIPQGEGMAGAIASHNQWNLEQRGFVDLIALDAIRG